VCHRCEDQMCDYTTGRTLCYYQLQGVERLPINVPTVTDTPFAVGVNVTHRYFYLTHPRQSSAIVQCVCGARALRL
jgi:hypothetical protein